MTRARCLSVVFLALLAAGATASDRPPSAAAADRGALAEIVEADRVVTAPETPGFAAYARDLAGALLEWISRLVGRLAPGMDALVVEIARVGAGVVFAAALALLAVLLVRVLRDHGAHRSRSAPDPVTVARDEGRDDRPHEEWAGELRRRLAAGNAVAACEALWWWLARRVAGGAAESSWTSRELLARSGRRDLAAPVRRLDRMIYGAAPPGPEDVRHLWRELEEAVG